MNQIQMLDVCSDDLSHAQGNPVEIGFEADIGGPVNRTANSLGRRQLHRKKIFKPGFAKDDVVVAEQVGHNLPMLNHLYAVFFDDLLRELITTRLLWIIVVILFFIGVWRQLVGVFTSILNFETSIAEILLRALFAPLSFASIRDSSCVVFVGHLLETECLIGRDQALNHITSETIQRFFNLARGTSDSFLFLLILNALAD